MNKPLLIVLPFSLIFLSLPIFAQSYDICARLKDDHATAQKKVDEVAAQKIGLDDTYSVLDDPKADPGELKDVLESNDRQLKNLLAKIAGGDRSEDNEQKMNSLKNRIALVNLRIQKFDPNTFYKDSRFIEFQKALNRIKDQELEAKQEVARIETDMDVNHCGKPEVKKDDLGGGGELEFEEWAGKWKNTDASKGNIRLTLQGSGSSISGDLHFYGNALDAEYDIVHNLKDCVETGNRLNCNWDAHYEDHEKTVDMTGTAQFVINAGTLNSNWKETSMTPHWKPGKERQYDPRPLNSYSIEFKKE
jgi:hypothetical protein